MSPTADQDDLLVGIGRVLSAAQDAAEAADREAETPDCVREATMRTLEETRTLLNFASSSMRMSPTARKRQSFSEFTALLGEEVKEAAEEHLVNTKRTLRKARSLVEDHFQIDEAFRMLGPLRQDPNLSRDAHDAFNLVALVPVIVLDVINWRIPESSTCVSFLDCWAKNGLTTLWHGEAFGTFWWITFIYFVADLLWVTLLPNCVRSPGVIKKHHIATLGYIFVPKFYPKYSWLMGSCMIVEVNTWFLIARRSFNKNGDRMFTTGVPLSKSLRLLVVSFFFYTTWFIIRLGFYPALLIVIIKEAYLHALEVGTLCNMITLTPVVQSVLLGLNIKWTIDLARSKLKSRDARPSKGL